MPTYKYDELCLSNHSGISAVVDSWALTVIVFLISPLERVNKRSSLNYIYTHPKLIPVKNTKHPTKNMFSYSDA